MARLWFLDHMSRALVPSRMRKACCLMELDEKHTNFIMDRFAYKRGMLGSEPSGFDEYTQRKMMPELDAKVRGWAEANPAFFKFIELLRIAKYFEKNK